MSEKQTVPSRLSIAMPARRTGKSFAEALIAAAADVDGNAEVLNLYAAKTGLDQDAFLRVVKGAFA